MTVTSSVVVDTATYWTPFGQATIIVLVQIGGLGILTGAALLFLVVLRRLGLRTRLVAQAETPGVDLGDLRRIVLAVGALALIVESLATVILALRLWLAYDYSLPSSLWRGVFLAIGAFNNAGFSLWSNSFVPFATDWWMSLTVAFTIIIGGLGVPVWLDLIRRDRAPRRLSLHSKLTLSVTLGLIVLGTVAVIGFEWTNPGTLGALHPPGRVLAGFFQAVSPRSAGYNSIDYSQIKPETAFSTDALMFFGDGQRLDRRRDQGHHARRADAHGPGRAARRPRGHGLPPPGGPLACSARPWPSPSSPPPPSSPPRWPSWR